MQRHALSESEWEAACRGKGAHARKWQPEPLGSGPRC